MRTIRRNKRRVNGNVETGIRWERIKGGAEEVEWGVGKAALPLPEEPGEEAPARAN